MATHTHTGNFSGKPLKSYKEAAHVKAQVDRNNQLIGARNWTTRVVQRGDGYVVEETSPNYKGK